MTETMVSDREAVIAGLSAWLIGYAITAVSLLAFFGSSPTQAFVDGLLNYVSIHLFVLLPDFGNLTLLFYSLLPMVLLVAFSYHLVPDNMPTKDAAVAGSRIAYGYLIPTVVALLLAFLTGAPLALVLSWLFLVGGLFPVVFGAIGGVLAVTL